ncbi:MAG: aldose epimerase [Cyanobacteria bacterium P01_H01_bin.15]
MFGISKQVEQYTAYELSDDQAPARALLVPERGGIVTLWSWQGQEIFYLNTARFKDPSKSVRGGIPLLFPICGNLVDDAYTFDGKSYSLVQHGFGRTLPWTVTTEKTDDAASLTVSLSSNEETKAVYPFEFVLDYVTELSGNTLTQIYRHTNKSDVPMPFSTGIHPYFLVKDKTKLDIQLPTNQYRIKGDPTLRTFEGSFDFEQPEIDFAFEGLTGQQAIVRDLDRGLQLTLSFDQNYSTLVFWTQKGMDFYCLEPWSGPRNAMNTEEALLTAAPGETVETRITFCVDVL